MTDFEFKFPRQVTMGSKAFAMGVLRQNNPYTDKKDREAWDRGYSAAKRKYEADRYRLQKQEQEEAVAAGFPRREVKSAQRFDFRRNPAARPNPQQISSFNNKFRTAS